MFNAIQSPFTSYYQKSLETEVEVNGIRVGFRQKYSGRRGGL